MCLFGAGLAKPGSHSSRDTFWVIVCTGTSNTNGGGNVLFQSQVACICRLTSTHSFPPLDVLLYICFCGVGPGGIKSFLGLSWCGNTASFLYHKSLTSIFTFWWLYVDISVGLGGFAVVCAARGDCTLDYLIYCHYRLG